MVVEAAAASAVSKDEENAATVSRNLVLSTFVPDCKGASPPGLIFGSMVPISATETIHFGGADEFRSYGELHVYSVSDGWRSVEVDSLVRPAPRYGHTASFFFGGGGLTTPQMYIVGGMGCIQSEINSAIPCFPPPLELPPDSSGHIRRWCHRGAPTDLVFRLDVTTNEWHTVAPLPAAVAFHSAITVADRFIVVCGGVCDSTLDVCTDQMQIFDTSSGRWFTPEQSGDIPSHSFGHVTELHAPTNTLYRFGGLFDCEGSLTLHSLDLSALSQIPAPDENTLLQTLPEMVWATVELRGKVVPAERRFGTFNSLGSNRLVLFGGLTAKATTDVYIFDVENRKWTRPLQDCEVNLAGHASCVLGGKLMIFGGCRAQFLDDVTAEVLMTLSSNPSAIAVGNSRLLKQVIFATVLQIKKSSLQNALKFKLITIGDSGVGKSSLLERFVQDNYDDARPATVGFDYCAISAMVHGKLITIQLWDTAGQERFDGLTGTYYRHADGFVLVYDSTRRSTFTRIERWVSKVKEHHKFGPECLKLIIGNKQDLTDELQVTNQEGMELADSMGGIYLGTSAKTGDGVDLAFLLAAGQMVKLRERNAAIKSVEFKLDASSVVDQGGVPASLSAAVNSVCGRC